MVDILTTDAWFPDDAIIRMERRDTGSITTFTTEVTNLNDGGGAKDTESIAHFGGAFLVINKPQEDFEVSFDVDVVDTTWMEIISADVTEVSGSARMVKSGGDQQEFKVKIEWVDTTNNEAYKIIYYGARGVDFSKDNAADDRLTGTISFKVAPTDPNGSPQRYEIETFDITDGSVGSAIPGSYGQWEEDADILHVYGVGSML